VEWGGGTSGRLYYTDVYKMVIALDNKTMAPAGLREGSFHAALPSDFAHGIRPSKRITSATPD